MAVLTYRRTFVRVPKRLQRVRLPAIAQVSPANGIFNLTNRFGEYARLSKRAGFLTLDYSSFGMPPYLYGNQITGTEMATEGRFTWNPERHLIVLYTTDLGIQEVRSYDNGKSWTGEEFVGLGTHGDIATDWLGTLQRSYWDGGTGQIQFSIENPGDTSPGPFSAISDFVPTPLLGTDDTFRIVGSREGRWWLHVRLQGEGSTSLWYTTDPTGNTWSRTDGAVGGITGGTHPGMTAGHDGSLFAFAYVAGKIQVTHRFPGETAWSTPAVLKTDTGSDFAQSDSGFSAALSWNGTNRLILATQVAGETPASDWWSADFLATVKRFT